MRKTFELIVFSNVTRYIYPEREQTRFCLNIGELEIESKAPETQRLRGEGGEKSAVQAEEGGRLQTQNEEWLESDFLQRKHWDPRAVGSAQILEAPGCHREKWRLHHSRQEGPESWFSAGLTRS